MGQIQSNRQVYKVKLVFAFLKGYLKKNKEECERDACGPRSLKFTYYLPSTEKV